MNRQTKGLLKIVFGVFLLILSIDLIFKLFIAFLGLKFIYDGLISRNPNSQYVHYVQFVDRINWPF